MFKKIKVLEISFLVSFKKSLRSFKLKMVWKGSLNHFKKMKSFSFISPFSSFIFGLCYLLAQSLWPHMSAAGAFFPTAPHEADAIIAA
jgi:hypothetical protein